MTPSREQLDQLVKLYQSGQFAAAEKDCLELLQASKESFALNNIHGLILQGLGKLQDAVKAHDAAIEIAPDNARAYSNRGTALMRQGDFKSAQADFDRAIELQPELEGAHLNRGMLLRRLGQLHEARASYEKAIELQPRLAEAWSSFGNVLKDLGRIEEALSSYQKAIQLDPDSTQAHSNLLMAYNYLPEQDKKIETAAQAYATAVHRNTSSQYTHPSHQSHPDRLRIGFVSGDLRNHPVGYLLADALPHLGAGRLELFAFSATPALDELSKRIRPCFEDWLPIYGKNNREAAQLIHEQRIDILIDLAGHTANNRLPLFAYKPAAIQLSWLGYFATTGLAEIDYVLTDPHLSPEGSESQFIEQLWRLPESRWCFSKPDHDCDVTPLPALKNGCLTFACFQSLSKINGEVIKLWSEVLCSLPGSRLLLKNSQCRDLKVREELQHKFSSLGVAPERIDIEGPEPRERYLEAYQRVDIALDTFPFSGGVTSLEGLWMGVPYITLAGTTMAGRQGVSILRNVSLADRIAEDKSEYVGKAVELAADLNALVQLRSNLRQRLGASSLMDSQQFAQSFEQELFTMWDQLARTRSS